MAGVLSVGDINVLTSIKTEFVKALIKEDRGTTTCPELQRASACIEKAVEDLEKLATEGHAFAQFQLAETYRRSFPPKLKQAFQWYQRAVKQEGFAEAYPSG